MSLLDVSGPILTYKCSLLTTIGPQYFVGDSFHDLRKLSASIGGTWSLFPLITLFLISLWSWPCFKTLFQSLWMLNALFFIPYSYPPPGLSSAWSCTFFQHLVLILAPRPPPSHLVVIPVSPHTRSSSFSWFVVVLHVSCPPSGHLVFLPAPRFLPNCSSSSQGLYSSQTMSSFWSITFPPSLLPYFPLSCFILNRWCHQINYLMNQILILNPWVLVNM